MIIIGIIIAIILWCLVLSIEYLIKVLEPISDYYKKQRNQL